VKSNLTQKKEKKKRHGGEKQRKYLYGMTGNRVQRFPSLEQKIQFFLCLLLELIRKFA